MRKNKRYMKMYSIMLATTLAVGLSACGKSDTATNDSVSVAEADMEADQENETASAEDAEEVAVEESEKEESSKKAKEDSKDKTEKESAEKDKSEKEDSDSAKSETSSRKSSKNSTSTSKTVAKDSTSDDEDYTDTTDGGHAIEIDGTTAEYSDIEVTKTGDSDGDEADFYGENAAIFATNGAILTLKNITVNTDGKHANGIFSYGSGTTVNVSDSYIYTKNNCSGGLMATGGGTINATNLTIVTEGNSSAAIRSDRGGGTINVTKGTYTTHGTGSPAIYSTADITVNDATLTSTASQGVVVEGQNSVTLNNVILTADNNTKNSDKSDYYQAVMIYQSMSGDADEGTASFTMNGGSLTNKNGDIFFVNNTVATIDLTDVDITNEDSDGVFLRAEAAGWGNEGSNGGNVTLTASNQEIDGDIIVDDVSTLNLYLTDGSSFSGAINSDGEAGDVYVEISDSSVWTLTDNSNISSLTCGTTSIDLNGYTLYVDGQEYTSGTSSTGTAVEANVSSGGGNGGADNPGGEPPAGGMPEGEPPAMPE